MLQRRMLGLVFAVGLVLLAAVWLLPAPWQRRFLGLVLLLLQ